jgi:hypothetical protein
MLFAINLEREADGDHDIALAFASLRLYKRRHQLYVSTKKAG